MRGIAGLLFDNLGLKLVSLLMALVVYLNVYTDRPATMLVTFPVEVTGLPDSLAVVRRDPTTITAELRGTGKQLIRLRLTEPSLRMSMAGAHAGMHFRRVLAGDLPLSDAEPLEVVRLIEPVDVELQIERVIARSVRVVARFNGANPARLPKWVADPPTVLLRGPRSIISAVDSVLLEPVKTGSGDSLRIMARVAALPEGCVSDPEAVTVRVVAAPRLP